MGYMDTILVLLSLLISFLYSVECLKCLQCSSFDFGCREGTVDPRPCYNESLIYCLKYEAKDKDQSISFVTRDCSDEKLSGCVNQRVNNKDLTVCKMTCMEDGCNGAATLRRSSRDIVHLVTFAVAATFVICL